MSVTRSRNKFADQQR
ncbi:hypothetical protein C351_03883 [Cryptococcus neoformans c8]|nr:hypothetical protein C351_03883 [Cryptococcus neoformans var. grubii c8]